MKTGMKESSYFLILFMILMIVVIGLSLKMPHFESKFLPILVSCAGLVLGTIGLIREIWPSKTKTGNKRSERNEEAKLALRSYMIPLAWIFSLAIAIFLFGFLVPLPLFILAYMKINKTGWLTSVLSAVLTTAIVYGVFEFALRVTLYRGLIPAMMGF